MADVLIRGGHVIARVEVSTKESETHNLTSQATETPIQSGAIVSDHVILKPICLDVVFSSANTSGTGQSPQAVYDAFYGYWQNKTLLTVYTEHRVHENMVVVGFTPIHRAPFKGALACTMRLQQIRSVSLNKVPYVNAILPPALPEVNRGSAAPVVR